MKTVIILLEKKPKATECSDFRTISLISHACKIVLKILTSRIEAKSRDFIGDDQFGFRKGLGTREAIASLRTVCERSIELDQDVYVCFVDYEKAFDRVNWKKLMKVLLDIDIDWKDRRLVAHLRMGQTALVRIAGEESEPASLGHGVRQGCPLYFLTFIRKL